MGFEDKIERQEVLAEVLQREECSNQHDVVQAMKKRGYAVTQPSISRDFQELGVVKVSGRYVIADVSANGQLGTNTSSSLVTTIEAVGPHLIVAKTTSGAASVVAAKIDRLDVDGLVGTVAGDDTIFLATKNRRAQQRVRQVLVTIGV